MSRSVAAPLQGPLYFFSFGAAACVVALGLTFIISGPKAAEYAFAIPAGGPLALGQNSANSYVAIIGVRDLTLAFLNFAEG